MNDENRAFLIFLNLIFGALAFFLGVCIVGLAVLEWGTP